MSLTRTNREKKNALILSTLDELVPKSHIVRKMERHFDMTFIYDEVEHLYSNVGQRSIDPVVFFKVLLIKYMFGIKSVRETMRQIEVNIAYRWYLGYSMDDQIPHHSTISKTYYRKFHGTDIFEKIFYRILKIAEEHNYIDYEDVFADATHIKAYANKNKFEEHYKEVVTTISNELYSEILAKRSELGKSDFELEDTGDEVMELILKDDNNDKDSHDDNDPHVDNDSPGNSNSKQKIHSKKVLKKQTKVQKVSLNDPEAGYYYRDEKAKGFMYQDHRMVDGKNNFIINTLILPGNIHDSKAFESLLRGFLDKNKNRFKRIALDSGYNSLDIMKLLKDNDIYSVIGYRRFNKSKDHRTYYYKKEEDVFVCKLGCAFTLKNVSKNGYMEYHDANQCAGCPCPCYSETQNKKVFRKHLLEYLRDENDQRRRTTEGKLLYKERSKTVERSFADAKQNHGLRWTNYTGRKTNQDYNWLLCATQNLKKICILQAIEYAKEMKKGNKPFISSLVSKILKLIEFYSFKNEIKIAY